MFPLVIMSYLCGAYFSLVCELNKWCEPEDLTFCYARLCVVNLLAMFVKVYILLAVFLYGISSSSSFYSV